MKTGYPSQDRNHEKYFGPEVMNVPLPTGETIYDYLLRLNRKRLSLPAISYFANSISYQEFFANGELAARALHNAGARKGDFITAIVPAMPEAFYLLLGASKLGIAVSYVDPRYGEKAIEHKINDTKSSIVIAFDGVVKTFNRRSGKYNSQSIMRKLFDVVDGTPVSTIVSIPVFSSTGAEPNPDFEKGTFDFAGNESIAIYSWSDFIAKGRHEDICYPEFQPNMPVAVVSTGGSTGTPKSAVFTNENIIQATAQVKMIGVFPEEARWYDIMPPSIAYGLADGSVLGFSLGNEVRLNPDPTAMSVSKPNQLQMVEDFVRFDPHTITCAPNHVFAILDSEEWLENPHSLVSFGVGGDSLNPSQVARANEVLKQLKRPPSFDKERFFGDGEDRVVLNFGYGSTEVTGCASVGPCNRDVRVGTVGLTLPHQVVSAFEYDEDAEEYRELEYVTNDELGNVPQEKIGELCVEGPNIMMGYLNNPEETSKVIRVHSDGKKWVHMGDLGFVDEDGYVHYLDRLKYISVGYDGFKVAPVEIEEVVLKHESINQCKAVILPDPDEERGNIVKVFYTVRDGFGIANPDDLENELNEMCALELADYKCPVGYEQLESLPVTNSGKIDVLTLRERACRG